MLQRRTIAVLACGLAAACASSTEPEGRGPGVIDIYADGRPAGVLQLPETIRAGVTFEAVVTTFGSSGCTRADGAEVRQLALVAEITPYDVHAPENSVCTQDLRAFPRSVALRFSAPGNAVIRVRGRSLYRDEAVVEQLVTVQ